MLYSKAHLGINRIDDFPSMRVFMLFIVCICAIAFANSQITAIYNLVSGKCDLSSQIEQDSWFYSVTGRSWFISLNFF